MKYVDENSIKKLISLIKGDLAKKQDSITVSGLLKGDGTIISAAVEEMDYMAPPTGGIAGQILKKTETGTEWADAPFKPEGTSYLTFSSPLTFTISTTPGWDGILEYYKNGAWFEWDGSEITADQFYGDYVLYFRGVGNTIITGNAGVAWTITGKDVSCFGVIESLLDYATIDSGSIPFMGDYCFYQMFKSCESIISTPEFTSTTLSNYCYSSMFSRCSYLKETCKSLPAKELTSNCYNSMFWGCTNLIKAPSLIIESISDYSCNAMFTNCTRLVSYFLNITSDIVLYQRSFGSMFFGTRITTPPKLPSTTLAEGCYQSMFESCISLTTAPELPATTLAKNCYSSMFFKCTSLTTAPKLPATTLAERCYSSMFSKCTSLTTAPKLPATTLAEWCYSSMFESCISLTTASELPATTLAQYCYDAMFNGCTSLIIVPELPATTLAQSCYFKMFYGCVKVKISAAKTDEYTKEYRIPKFGDGVKDTISLMDMFTSTGGTFTGTPEINTTYYLSSDNMIVRDTEIATLNGYVGSMIDAVTSKSVSATLATSGWVQSGNGYEQTVNVTGVTASSSGSLRIAQSATDEQFAAWGAAKPRVTAQADGTLTVKVTGTVPTVDIPVEVLIV